MYGDGRVRTKEKEEKRTFRKDEARNEKRVQVRRIKQRTGGAELEAGQCVSERVTMGERVGHKLFKHLLRLLLFGLGKGRQGWMVLYVPEVRLVYGALCA